MKTLFGISAAAVVAFGVVLDGQWIPLGAPSEWDWERIPRDLLPAWTQFLPALLLGAALIAWVAAGSRWVDAASRPKYLSGLMLTAALAGAFQVALEIPCRHGLGKWILAVYAPQVTGFFQVAKHAPANTAEILRGYPELVRHLPPGHISANPPGWVIVDRALMGYFHDAARRRTLKTIELGEMNMMFDRLAPPNIASPEERSAAVAVALLSRLTALFVIFPTAWLAFLRYGRWGGWLAAGAAGMIPAVTMFAPRCDCVYATFATLVVALSHYAVARADKRCAFAAGVLVGIGMLFSLCFLVAAAYAMAVAGVFWFERREFQRGVAISFVAGTLVLPLAVLLFTGCNLGHIWLANLAKNAEFNQLTGRTYWLWATINPIEFLIAIGLPAGILLIRRLFGELRVFSTVKPDNVAIAWLAIMLLLNFSGNNRAEVARLWIFMMPSAVALAFERLPKDWRVAAAFLGLQSIAALVLARELTVM